MRRSWNEAACKALAERCPPWREAGGSRIVTVSVKKNSPGGKFILAWGGRVLIFRVIPAMGQSGVRKSPFRAPLSS